MDEINGSAYETTSVFLLLTVKVCSPLLSWHELVDDMQNPSQPNPEQASH